VDRSKFRLKLPVPFLALLAAYFLASLAHFSHNAQYIAFYPGLPGWLTPEKVYLAWLAVSSIGVLGFVVRWFGWQSTSLLLLGLYGAFGLDGLAHYTLALCSEHTLVANVTIWSEAAIGLTVLLASAVLFSRRLIGGRGRAG
jgi:hypothetical protein